MKVTLKQLQLVQVDMTHPTCTRFKVHNFDSKADVGRVTPNAQLVFLLLDMTTSAPQTSNKTRQLARKDTTGFGGSRGAVRM